MKWSELKGLIEGQIEKGGMGDPFVVGLSLEVGYRDKDVMIRTYVSDRVV
jgi:hypothetical protein